MLKIRFSIALRLSIALLFANTVAYAQDSSEEKTHSPICRGCHGLQTELNPLTGVHHDGDEGPQAIKQRAGPGNPESGRDKSELCQGCHGEDGNSLESHVPKLSGQYAGYITKQLRNYQTGVRTHQIMNAMAATLSDEDLDDIAAYYAIQPKMDGRAAAFNLIGQKLFFHSDGARGHMACVNCHGQGGKGLTPGTAMFPVIGGQHKDYLFGQLVSFKFDNRSNSPNAIMNKICKALTVEELTALAEYLSEQ